MAIHKFKDFNLDIEVPAAAPKFFTELIDNSGWERYECEIISKAVNSRHRVLEGGAGLGVTSAIIGRQASFAVSFEANPVLSKVARKNQILNHSKTKIINAALGASEGFANFLVKPDWWDSRVADRKTTKTHRTKIYDTQKIIETYDINALILDVEGEEEKIIPRIDLSKLKLLIIELHGNIDKRYITNFLEANGLKRKNDLAKSDHSVVWFERRSDSFVNLRQIFKNRT